MNNNVPITGPSRSPGPVDLRSLRLAAVVNTSSGSCGADCAQTLEEIFREAQLTPIEIVSVGAGEITAALAKQAQSPIDLLVVVGGDGTIRTAAERCIGTNVILMPLPGGTMNMLPKALYGTRSWPDALRETLANPTVRSVGGGRVGDYRFFCVGIFGAPALWADVREATREAKFLTALRSAFKAYRRAFARRVSYVIGGGKKRGFAEAVSVICPTISAVLPDQAPVLEVAALDPGGAMAAFHLALTAVFSDWRKDPDVTTARATSVTISGAGRVPAILDGETVRLPRRFQVTFAPHCFDALVPVETPEPTRQI